MHKSRVIKLDTTKHKAQAYISVWFDNNLPVTYVQIEMSPRINASLSRINIARLPPTLEGLISKLVWSQYILNTSIPLKLLFAYSGEDEQKIEPPKNHL